MVTILRILLVLIAFAPVIHLGYLGCRRWYLHNYTEPFLVRELRYRGRRIKVFANVTKTRWVCVVMDCYGPLEEYKTKCYNNFHSAITDVKNVFHDPERFAHCGAD